MRIFTLICSLIAIVLTSSYALSSSISCSNSDATVQFKYYEKSGGAIAIGMLTSSATWIYQGQEIARTETHYMQPDVVHGTAGEFIDSKIIIEDTTANHQGEKYQVYAIKVRLPQLQELEYLLCKMNFPRIPIP